jgi:hypothetical protein
MLMWWGCGGISHLQYKRNPPSIVVVVNGQEEQ